MKKSWIYKADGTVIEKGTSYESQRRLVNGDLPDFISPIDGKRYSGRTGLREHNLRHNVINNEELVGLPYETFNKEYKPDREAIREKIIETVHRKGYM